DRPQVRGVGAEPARRGRLRGGGVAAAGGRDRGHRGARAGIGRPARAGPARARLPDHRALAAGAVGVVRDHLLQSPGQDRGGAPERPHRRGRHLPDAPGFRPPIAAFLQHRGGDRPGARGVDATGGGWMKPVQVTDELEDYMLGLLPKRDAVLTRLEERAAREGVPIVGPHEGMLLHVLARAANAKRILELGAATGYSGLWLLRGGGAEASLTTIEMDPARAALARSSLAEAGAGLSAEV